MANPFKYWIMAIRPRTLPAAISPVLIGTAMAFGDGVSHWPSALAALIGALLIQIGTNLANDYFDFKKGADTKDRLGPVRVTQAGLISPQAVKWGFILSFALAALICNYLILRAGWPVLVIGILSILSGIFYTAGPRPLGYMGLGEFFALVFFGPVAVAGTYYVQSFEWNGAVILAGLAPGFFSAAILTVNNLRDIETDRGVGKKTLAVRFGRTFARCLYLTFIIAAAGVPVGIHVLTEYNPAVLFSSLIVFLAIPTINDVFTSVEGLVLNRALERTGILLLIFSLAFSITWIF